MDADLVAEIERLQKIHEERGLYDFLCECQDCWLASQALCRPSPLFALCSPDGKLRMRRDGQLIGCPFSIRRSDLYRSPLLFAWTDEWTAAIRSDDRIPLNEARMRPEKLWVLAEWQQTIRDYFNARRRFAQRRSRLRKSLLRQNSVR